MTNLKALALEIQKLDSTSKITIALTPAYILQYRNEVLADVLKALGRFSLQTEITDAIEALKTKEPT